MISISSVWCCNSSRRGLLAHFLCHYRVTLVSIQPLIIRKLGMLPWQTVSEAMHHFTDTRTDTTADEVWLVEHPPVFTQGQAGKAEHLLAPGDIPVVQSDRGGQVTYHAPGQQIFYVLLDIRRLKTGVRQLVTLLEQTVIETLADFGITACTRADAPGVYVDGKKICSLGLRIRKGCSFHGLALNTDMDLSPFLRINPCGYAGLEMTQIADLVPAISLSQTAEALVQHFLKHLPYTQTEYRQGLPEAE